MNCKSFLLPLVLVILLAASCSNNDQETRENINPHKIQLIDGAKWEVDPEMTGWIESIGNSLQDFNGSTVEDYQSLAKSISQDLIELTSNCTMKGQAHDELHKWLVPFIGLSDEFDEITTVNEGNALLSKMKDEFEIFNKYFK